MPAGRPTLLLVAALLALAPRLAAAPIDTAAGVLSLTRAQAGERRQISVTGVVTTVESDWRGQFFVDDGTGGVFVENIDRPAPALGDVVRVDGVSQPGAFAPIIGSPTWTRLGHGALPEPRQVALEALMAGTEDGRRIELTGVVRAARIEPGRLALDLAVGGYRLQVLTRARADLRPEALVAARVRVRGTAATHYNAALGHLTAVAVYAPDAEDFVVLEAEQMDPFAQAPTPLNAVAQYRHGGTAGRLHVRGTVTLQRVGEDLFLQDDTGGLRVAGPQTEVFAVGDQVEAAGFLEFEQHLPVLRDATVRRIPGPRAPAVPQPATITQIKAGLYHAAVVTLRGRVIDRSTQLVTRPGAGFNGRGLTWLVQGSGLGFTVEWEDRGEDATLAAVPVGSVVAVDGVCVPETDAEGHLRALRLLLASPAGMRILERPSSLTPERLLAGVGLLTLVLLVAVAWLLTMAKKNTALNFMVRQLEQAQAELQEAHDTLEQKVVERSAQLQVEMTARKAAELEFKAVLAERTRLARDLHDTLEQTLTGIALQLDTAAKLFQREPESARGHLQQARNWLHQSQVGLRRSIWDLRSRELEQFDLARALLHSGEQLVEGTPIQFAFHTAGAPRDLPEVVEENVLRIGQEALTNIAKHARAAHITVTLEYAPHQLRLRVEDDGIGFEHGPAGAPGQSHFGLIGMAERAKRLAGRLTIDSARGRGTVLTVEIPLEPANAAANPSAGAVPSAT